MYLARVNKEAITERARRKKNMQYDEAKKALELFLTGTFGDIVEVKDMWEHWNNNNDMNRTLTNVIEKEGMLVRAYMKNGSVYLERVNGAGANIGKDE